MSDNILSQAEIDALLNDDAPSSNESATQPKDKEQVRPYDPNTQRRVIRERMQSLKLLTSGLHANSVWGCLICYAVALTLLLVA